MATRMLQRRGTAAEWASENPVLSAGEIGIETDTGTVKVGNGVDAWSALTMAWLPVAGGTMTGALLLQAPTLDNHAARKIDVDSAGISGFTGDTIVRRDVDGRSRFASPSHDNDAAIKGYVDAVHADVEYDDTTLTGCQIWRAGPLRTVRVQTQMAPSGNIDVLPVGDRPGADLDLYMTTHVYNSSGVVKTGSFGYVRVRGANGSLFLTGADGYTAGSDFLRGSITYIADA